MKGSKKSKDSTKDISLIVGIGSSAGGLEALKRMIPNLPGDLNIAYIIVQHQDPRHKSMMVDLLSPSTAMSVLEVVNNATIEPNTIYITPPGENLIISDKTLSLSKPLTTIGPKPSIDLFFRYLAEQIKEKTVGVVLSGTGSDGSNGIRAIKAEGGIVIVQSEDTAKFNGMPKSAINTGNVDMVLAPEEIGKRLPELVKFSYQANKLKDNEDESSFSKIFTHIANETSIDFSKYKQNTIVRRIKRRMAILKLTNIDKYENYLATNQNEVNELQKDLLISVTSFFRDKNAFESLKTILKEYLDKKLDFDIRIWVPGCATGEEAYSIGIILSEILQSKISKYDIQIFGTDLDTDAITIARQARYSEASIINLDSTLIDTYFKKQRGSYKVIQSIRDMVIFAKHNLISAAPFARLDMISCRNLLIYFSSELQTQVLPLFHYGLMPSGILFLGKSESISHAPDLFIPIDEKWRIYKRRDVQSPESINIKKKFSNTKAEFPRITHTAYKDNQSDIKEYMRALMIDRLGLKAVAINDKMTIIHIMGDVNIFLKINEGKFNNNLLDLIHNDLRLDFRGAFYKCVRTGEPQTTRKVKISSQEARYNVSLDVSKLFNNKNSDNLLYLIIFNSEQIAIPKTKEETVIDNNENFENKIKDLEHELHSSREQLQTTIEELETANEELQSLTEELQSSNEELQSSNEELETANEELQSTNEELTTVNEELQIKTTELSNMVSDLQNIFKIIGFAVVVVNKYLKITRFNELASDFFIINPNLNGERITDIQATFSLPNLQDIIIDVMHSEKDYQTDLKIRGLIYWFKVMPYYDENEIVSGAIITLFDQTKIRNIESALRSSEERFELAMAASNDGVWDWKIKDQVLYFSPRYRSMLGYSEDDERFDNMDFIFSLIHQEDQEKAHSLINKLLSGSSTSYESIHRMRHHDNYYIWILDRAISIKNNLKHVTRIVGTSSDITRLIVAESNLNDISQTLQEERNLFISGPVVVLKMIFTFNLPVIYASQNFQENLVKNTNNDTDKTIRFLNYISVEDRDNLMNELELVVNDKKKSFCHRPYRFIDNNGNIKWIQQYSSLSSNESEKDVINVYLIDITKEKSKEKQVNDIKSQLYHAGKLASIGELSSVIAHEIRQPLTILQSDVEIMENTILKGLENTDLQNNCKEAAKTIKKQINKAQTLLENLNNYSRKDKNEEKIVYIDDIIQDIVTFYKAHFLKDTIEISVTMDEVPLIKINPQFIEQIILNLLNNARHALLEKNHKDKKIDITLKHLKSNNMIEISIKDNGTGIPPEIIDKCKEAFFTTKKSSQGTGLGLSIINNIVTDMNGVFLINSIVNKYSEFIIKLPVKD